MINCPSLPGSESALAASPEPGRASSPTLARERCPGCDALAPNIDGPIHPYIASSPGCWAVYSEVLAREYEAFGFPSVHRLTADSYAAQHPGGTSPLASQSLAAHLAGLHLVLDRGYDFAQATAAMSLLLRASNPLPHFAPPPTPGALTVLDVRAATNVEEHVELVNRWAESTWAAWSEEHTAIAHWIDLALMATCPARS